MNGSWEVSQEFQPREARYGHCAALVGEDKIVVIGGHSEAIIETVEILNISNNTLEDCSDLRTPRARWGLTCTALGILDLDTRTWSQGPDLPWPESWPANSIMWV